MEKEFYVVLDNIRSLENVGSIFRTADALGVNKIFLCGITAQPPAGESREKFLQRKSVISKTALGAEQNMSFEYCKSALRLIRKLKNSKIKIIALEQDKKSLDYNKFKPRFPLALILGNEVGGISKKVLAKCDTIIELPMRGKKESLNVAVAFGIAGYCLTQDFKRVS
jgi:tRNA G18 (ribose-2'-O)-methylase SpoU